MQEQPEGIELPNKPLERSRLRSGTGIAEFQIGNENAEHAGKRKLKVPLFHESPASTETQRKTERGN